MAVECVSGTSGNYPTDVSCAFASIQDLREELDCCEYVRLAIVTEAREGERKRPSATAELLAEYADFLRGEFPKQLPAKHRARLSIPRVPG